MTSTLDDVRLPAPHSAQPPPWWLVLGASLLAGFTLGVVARAWMRVISDDPDFSWSGTRFIVGAFVVFSVAQALAALGRRSRRRWFAALARVVGAVGLLPLFVGAGAFMLPTVVFGGVAVHRPPRRRLLRAVVILAAVVPFFSVVNDVRRSHGFGVRLVVGALAIAATYAAVIAMARPTFAANPTGLRVPKVLMVVLWIALMGMVALFAVGLATAQ